MGFDLGAELSAVRGQGYDLHSKYLNPQLPRTLRTIGFDKDYVRGEGAYLYDAEGNAYADFLAGFGVFAAGRSHPVIKKALHDALDMDFAAWTQFDCQPIAGLLAQRLIAKTPGLDRVFFCSSGTEAVMVGCIGGSPFQARRQSRPARRGDTGRGGGTPLCGGWIGGAPGGSRVSLWWRRRACRRPACASADRHRGPRSARHTRAESSCRNDRPSARRLPGSWRT